MPLNAGNIRIQGRHVVGGVVITATFIAAQWAFTGQQEGRRYRAYYDQGHVLTVCDGHTGKDIIPNHTYTDAECDALFQQDLMTKAIIPLEHMLKPSVSLPVKVLRAILDWIYNVGAANAAASTLIRLLNADYTGHAICDQFPRWVYVKNVFSKGLYNRRVTERQMCLDGYAGK